VTEHFSATARCDGGNNTGAIYQGKRHFSERHTRA
jgi:hypothetical protein